MSEHDGEQNPRPAGEIPAEEAAERRRRAAAASRLDDEQLLGQCEMEFFTAGGPGGQHRNKTESGVRLRHLPTGLTSMATERRSQAQNRQVALQRLRVRLQLAAHVPRARKKTVPSLGARLRRLTEKRRTAERKQSRRRPGEE